MMFELLYCLLVLVILITGLVAVFHPRIFGSIILFGAFSYFVVLTYLLVGAADVAFTEAVIGVISTAYFVSALRELRKDEK